VHEAAIAQSLLEIVKEQALLHGARRVSRVRVRVGALSGVVPEALTFAFEAMSKGGIAEGAVLEVEEVPSRIRCEDCGVFEGTPFLVCPNCGKLAELLSGRELEIISMEIEDGG